jgi:predicted amidohydrolase YtcJ
MRHADTILTGGRIFLGLEEGEAEALAIADGRILATGSDAEIQALAGPATRVIQLDGRAATPGLIDAHLHLLTLGLGMGELNLRPETGTSSIDDILSAVRNAVAQAPPGTWIKGRGYDHNELSERRHPALAELDSVAPDHPVFLERTCGHLAVANSAAMRLAGISGDTPDPAGGFIERRNGELTGLLAERGMRFVVDILPRPDRENMIAAIERAGHFMLSQGFTGVMDAAIGMNFGIAEVDAFEAAAAVDRIPLDVWACLYGDPGGVVEAAWERGLRFGSSTGRLRYGAAKLFTDGSAGSLTAAVGLPYLVGETGNTGVLCFETDELHGHIRRFHELGYQLAIHAIGDVAIEQVLSGIEAADSEAHPVAGRRHRIEHCGYLDAGQMARMAAAGIYPAPQPIFMYEFGDLYVTNLGMERAEAAYPMRSFLDAGLLPSASSDAPVATTDPFKNLYTMVTRKSRGGTLLGGDQRLSLTEALHCYTACSAFSQFSEQSVGTLAPGMRANIAVFSHDIFAVSPETLRDEVRCDLTILDGQIVYGG